jgi:hypothetical protein
MAHSSFYASLTPVDTFAELADEKSYLPLPDDWVLAVSDVAGSTRAIAAGNYRGVNTVGVSVIAAITNALAPLDLPYVFGGDGALVCVPGDSADAARRALAATAAMAQTAFGLKLRAAMVPVSYVREAGYDVLVARHRVSDHCSQCALHGGGSSFAEDQLKGGNLPAEYDVTPDADAGADFSGLECRWSEVPSHDSETVAVIISVAAPSGESLVLYSEVIAKIDEIYGAAHICRPVREDGLRITLAPSALENERKVRTWARGVRTRLGYAFVQRLQVVLGRIFFRFGTHTSETDWSVYKRDMVSNTDFRKFDGCLRLVLAGNATQRELLDEYLGILSRDGRVTYGIHVSTAAVVTCLVKHYQSAHVHFVDASGGGYASAARAMKERAARR